MGEIKDVPGKVETLLEEVNRLQTERDGVAARLASLENKAATQGKLSVYDFLKIGTFVVGLSTAVSALVQNYVEGEQLAAMSGLNESAVRAAVRLEVVEKESERARNWRELKTGELARLAARLETQNEGAHD
jgi:ABC-type cobalamin/Fe3+-siderophores transport system ATPase subunit